MKTPLLLCSLVLGLLLLGCDAGTAVAPELDEEVLIAEQDQAKLDAIKAFGGFSWRSRIDFAEVQVFQPAGEVGGGVLTPGTEFPPTKGGRSMLLRGNSWVQYNIHTTGLPPGAYTVWAVTIDAPENCATRPCGEADVFENPDTGVTIFWSDGGIVQSNGVGNFRARIHEGVLPDGEGQIGFPGNGLTNAQGAEIHLIIKYHGLVSDDPDVLYEQIHTLQGSCDVGANAYDLGPFGIHCFDPQVAIHMP